MRSIVSILFALVLGAACVSAQPQTEKAHAGTDEIAIRANVEQMSKGWNMKSGPEFAKPFADDSDYVVINGAHIKGRAGNAAGHQQIFDTIFKNSSLVLVVESIRYLFNEVAIVHVRSELRVDKADPATLGSGRITMVMKKIHTKWEIAAFQNTEIERFGRR